MSEENVFSRKSKIGLSELSEPYKPVIIANELWKFIKISTKEGVSQNYLVTFSILYNGDCYYQVWPHSLYFSTYNCCSAKI